MASLNSRRKLKPKDALRFAEAEPVLFRELAQVICQTGILPEKELHECWQMAQLVHEEFPTAAHIADIAAGHGLLSWILVLLAQKAEAPFLRTTVAVDITRPPSADIIAEAMKRNWPELDGRVCFVEGSISTVRANNGPGTLFVATHACGSLSDRVMISALSSGSSVAIMPCCHSLRGQEETLSALALMSGLSIDSILPNFESIDQFRMQTLRELGYTVCTRSIDAEISAFHRIIFGFAPTEVVKTHSIALEMSPPKRSGEIRAYEKIQIFDVSDFSAAKVLAQRPSREWRRVFDLSFWIGSEEAEAILRDELEGQFEDLPYGVNVKTLGQFLHPVSQRISVTFRFEILSSNEAITKEVALALRNEICLSMVGKFELRS